MKKFSIRYEEDKTTFEKIKINNESLIMIEANGRIEIGDEYHTIHDLYEHRMALTIALFNSWYIDFRFSHHYDIKVMKSKFHYDGTMFEGGYFIVMALTDHGQISYHYKLKYWDKFKIPEVEKAPEWDGHNSKDVLIRLENI